MKRWLDNARVFLRAQLEARRRRRGGRHQVVAVYRGNTGLTAGPFSGPATIPVKSVAGRPPWDELPYWAAPEAHRDSGYGYVSGSMGTDDGGGWREQIEAELGPDDEPYPMPWPVIAGDWLPRQTILVLAGRPPVPPHSDLGPRAAAVLDQWEQRRRERASGLAGARAQWAAAA